MKALFALKIMLLMNILFLQISSIDITLTPVLEDVTTDNYEIAKNTLSIKSNGDYRIFHVKSGNVTV